MRLKPLWVIVVAVSVSVPSVCADASMFRGGPEHSGVYNAGGVPTFSQVKWKFHTAGLVISSPAVFGDVVFVGGTDGNFYAVSSESGTLKWKFEAKSRITSSPAVSGGLVYFGAYDGNFYALDAATGQLKWKFQTAGERRYAARHLHGSQPAGETMPDPFDFYLSSPVVWNGGVFVGSGDGNVYALNAGSGTLQWKFKTGDVIHASPAIADNSLFIGSWDSYFYALDAATGEEKWRFKTGEDPDTHNQVGIQSSQGSWVIGSPAVADGKVYFATSDSGLFYSFAAKTGSPLFSLKFQGWPMFSSPAIAGNLIYIGSHMGKLIAIDTAAQKVSWMFETDGAKQNTAAWTKPDGTPNYEAEFASDFYDDLVTGVSKMMSIGAILSSPVVVGRVIYFGSADGNLYALI